MRIVVIGGTGHIGTYLVPRLVHAGHTVISISRGDRTPYRPDPSWASVEPISVDRDREDAADRFGTRIAGLDADAVVDLVCFTVDSAAKLADALAGTGTHLVHCGTIWVHGPGVELPVREDAPRRPLGEYGEAKAAIEELLLTRARRGWLQATVLHPGHIVGPGWHPVNPRCQLDVDVFTRLAAGDEVALPNLGMETLHHVHADDVAQCFQRALERPNAAVGESFHVTSERAVTLRGYAETVASWFGRPAKLAFVPWETWRATMSAADAEFAWGHMARSPSMSIEKAGRLLGYAPRWRSLDAIAESLAWLAAEGELDVGAHRLPGWFR